MPRGPSRKDAQPDSTGGADVLNFMQTGDENAYVGDAGSGAHNNNNIAPPPPLPHQPHTSTAGQAQSHQAGTAADNWSWTEDENLALNMVANAATAAHPANSQEGAGGAAERDEQAAAQQLGGVVSAQQQQSGEGGEQDESNKRTADQMEGEGGEQGFVLGGGKRPRPVDPSKRAAQNRAAQKAFRERRDG